MYRILDLIAEQSSSGLGKGFGYLGCQKITADYLAVEKVVIAQDSLKEFLNMICPGAYVSLTKVDFKRLDGITVQPVGVYGSKDEIVSFLTSLGAVDQATSVV